MTASEMLDNIKDDLNNNPMFDDPEIIRKINWAVKRVSLKTENAKAVTSLTCTQGTFNYPITDPKNFRIINIWYGQASVKTTGEITHGHERLRKLEREQLGSGMAGYWSEPLTQVGIPYGKEIHLSFDPTTGYVLIVEYTTWVEMPQTAFDNDEDLSLYFPEEAHDIIADLVVGRLKLNDGNNEGAKINLGIAQDGIDELEDVNKEKITHVDVPSDD